MTRHDRPMTTAEMLDEMRQRIGAMTPAERREGLAALVASMPGQHEAGQLVELALTAQQVITLVTAITHAGQTRH